MKRLLPLLVTFSGIFAAYQAPVDTRGPKTVYEDHSVDHMAKYAAQYPFHWAVLHDDALCVEQFLCHPDARKTLIESLDDNGRTALEIAFINRRVRCFAMLLLIGASITEYIRKYRQYCHNEQINALLDQQRLPML